MSIHRDIILATRFDAGGERVFTGSVEGAVGVWDVASGSQAAACLRLMLIVMSALGHYRIGET